MTKTRLPLDFTFCTGLRCELATKCTRWTSNNSFPNDGQISIAQFGNWDGTQTTSCEEFIDLEVGMTYSLRFEITDLPKMANSSGAKSTHWRHAQKEVKKWHGLVAYAVGRQKPASPLDRFTLTLTRYSSNPPDYDGLVRGFKSVVDGLKACGVIADDKLANTGVWDCRWVKAKPKHGKIEVIVNQQGELNEQTAKRGDGEIRGPQNREPETQTRTQAVAPRGIPVVPGESKAAGRSILNRIKQGERK